MDRKTAGGRQQTSAGNLTQRLTKPLDWTGFCTFVPDAFALM